MGLFGSYATGDATEQSDVDILVDVDPSIGLRFVTLAETIECSLELLVADMLEALRQDRAVRQRPDRESVKSPRRRRRLPAGQRRQVVVVRVG